MAYSRTEKKIHRWTFFEIPQCFATEAQKRRQIHAAWRYFLRQIFCHD